MFIFSFFSSSGQRAIALDEPQFNVLQSDEIYFRNIRMSAYIIQEDSASGFDLLKPKSLSMESTFSFVIVRNWRQKLAYIMPDRDSEFDRLVIQNRIARKLKDQDMEYNWETAVAAYNALSEGEVITLHTEEYAYVPNDAERKAFKNTIKDYLKLTHCLP